ncbi:MAG: ammonium transporter, partial [Spirochaetia bacterium]
MSSREVKSEFGKIILMTLMLVVLFSGMALAQEDQAAANAIAIDTMWTLVAAFLVFFMQAGFAMVEAGFTRAKNAGNIIMKNMMDFAS